MEFSAVFPYKPPNLPSGDEAGLYHFTINHRHTQRMFFALCTTFATDLPPPVLPRSAHRCSRTPSRDGTGVYCTDCAVESKGTVPGAGTKELFDEKKNVRHDLFSYVFYYNNQVHCWLSDLHLTVHRTGSPRGDPHRESKCPWVERTANLS